MRPQDLPHIKHDPITLDMYVERFKMALSEGGRPDLADQLIVRITRYIIGDDGIPSAVKGIVLPSFGLDLDDWLAFYRAAQLVQYHPVCFDCWVVDKHLLSCEHAGGGKED